MNLLSRTTGLLLTGLVAIAIAAFAALALPPDGPWSGDTGIRLLQTDTLMDTGDLAVPYLGQTTDPANRFNPLTPRYFSWQGTRFYPKFSPAYAYLSAAIGSTLGPRWYFLPALAGLIISGVAVALVLHRTGSKATWIAPAGLALTTPVVFYANELWEHSLATACATLGTAVLFLACQRQKQEFASWRSIDFVVRPDTLGLAVLGGAVLGAGLWLRGELYAFIPAVMLAMLLVYRQVWTMAATGAGVALLALPLWWYQSVLFGAAEGAQVAVDSPLVLRNAGPLYAAQKMLQQWGDTIPGLVLPQGPLLLWVVAGLLLVAGGVLLRRQADTRAGLVLGLGVGITVMLVLVNFALRLAPVDLVVSFPLGVLVVLAIAKRPTGTAGTAFMFVGLTAMLYLLASLFTAPSSGGAQHGPRYLLSVYPLWFAAVILAIEPWLAEADRPRKLVLASVIALTLASIATQVIGLRNLKVIKDQYAIAAQTAESTGTAPLVTDLWWYSQVVPEEVRRRPIFLVADNAAFAQLAALLRSQGTSEFIFVGSNETAPVADHSGALPGGGTVRRVNGQTIEARRLQFDRYVIE